jgi:hypothetical protein
MWGHHSERDALAMHITVEALITRRFFSMGLVYWRTTGRVNRKPATPAIARHADKNGSAGAIKQQKLKTVHAQLAREFSHYQQEYQDQRARANALLAATGGKRPSRWRPVKRHRFNDALGAMLDAYESMEQFRRVNTMHRLLFNAYATRDAMQQELLRVEAIRRSS